MYMTDTSDGTILVIVTHTQNRWLNMDEKQKSGNAMHYHMDSYFCGIDTSSEVFSLSISFLLFA